MESQSAKSGFRAVRLDRGLTVEQFAALARVDRSQVFRWERGETRPRPETLVRLAKALRVTPQRLLGELTIDVPEDAETPEPLFT